MLISLVFGEGKPGFGEIADAFEFVLHFGVLCLEERRVGVRRDFDGRGEDHDGFAEEMRQEEVVPSSLKRSAALAANVEDHDRSAGFAGEHDRTGLSDVTRTARAVDGERAVLPFCDAASHNRKTPQAAARRAALCGAVT